MSWISEAVMNERLKYAAELLKKENYTLVLYNGTELVTSKDKGIKPLLDLYKKADEIIENAKKNGTWKKVWTATMTCSSSWTRLHKKN